MGNATRSLAAILSLLAVGGMEAQQKITTPKQPASAVTSSVVNSTAPIIMPLAQIHEGMKGFALTVFQGVKPESMDVEVLGVMHNANGPKGDIILVRLHGNKPEYTGVVAGMSGSPVYFDGKLAGALAFRIGEFSKEPIAGVTPIEEMLEIDALDRGPAPATMRAGLPATDPSNQGSASRTASPGETPAPPVQNY